MPLQSHKKSFGFYSTSNTYLKAQEKAEWEHPGLNLISFFFLCLNQSIQQWHDTQLPCFPGREYNSIGEFGGRKSIGYGATSTSVKILNPQWQTWKVISAPLKTSLQHGCLYIILAKGKVPAPSEKKGWAESPTKQVKQSAQPCFYTEWWVIVLA